MIDENYYTFISGKLYLEVCYLQKEAQKKKLYHIPGVSKKAAPCSFRSQKSSQIYLIFFRIVNYNSFPAF